MMQNYLNCPLWKLGEEETDYKNAEIGKRWRRLRFRLV